MFSAVSLKSFQKLLCFIILIIIQSFYFLPQLGKAVVVFLRFWAATYLMPDEVSTLLGTTLAHAERFGGEFYHSEPLSVRYCKEDVCGELVDRFSVEITLFRRCS